MIFYDDYHNPILLTVFISNVVNLAFLLIITLFYLIGKGKKFMILNLFMFQVGILYLFFIPQIIGPFFLHTEDRGEYCEHQSEVEYSECMPDTFCKIQGITNNLSWFSSACFSILACHIISCSLESSSISISVEYNKWWWMIIFLIFSCNFPSLFAPFAHYGVTWGDQKVLYICNLKFDKGLWKIWWIFQLFLVFFIIVAATMNFRKVSNKIKELIQGLNYDLDSIKTLKINLIGIGITLVWTFNVIFKILDYCFEIDQKKPQWFIFIIPQILLQWMGLGYFEMFFYCFYDQIRPNLSQTQKKIFQFFYKFNILTVCYGDKKKIFSKESYLSSTLEQNNQASLLYTYHETATN